MQNTHFISANRMKNLNILRI